MTECAGSATRLSPTAIRRSRHRETMAKILIVDDQEVFREAVVRALRQEGITECVDPIEAENGAAALELVHEHDDIRFAVGDIHMPIMNGVEFLTKFREEKRERYDRCKTFIITTEASRTLRSQMKQLGVLAWLVKPVNPKLFIRTLQTRFADDLEAARREREVAI